AAGQKRGKGGSCQNRMGSALDAAGAVAAGQLLHVGDADPVEVADDGVLQAGGRHGELQGLLLVLIVGQAVDQAAGKAVAAAHTVDDVPDLVFLGDVEVLAVVEAGGPAVPVRAVALPQGDGDHLH